VHQVVARLIKSPLGGERVLSSALFNEFGMAMMYVFPPPHTACLT
jgi:hypothetical protein